MNLSRLAVAMRDMLERHYTIAFTPRQYRSHMERNLGWPPRSQLLPMVSRYTLDA